VRPYAFLSMFGLILNVTGLKCVSFW